MSYKEVSSLDADVTIALGKKNKETGKSYPKQIEGYYLGSRTVENKRGESKLHFFMFGTEDKGLAMEYKSLGVQTGQNIGVWGTTDLNRKLPQSFLGRMTRITSTGTKPTPNGDMYTYKVETDAGNTIEVSAVSEESNSDVEFEETIDAEYSSEDDNQATELAALERKTKVEALLRGGKSKTK